MRLVWYKNSQSSICLPPSPATPPVYTSTCTEPSVLVISLVYPIVELYTGGSTQDERASVDSNLTWTLNRCK